jgi:predicted SnoaL-like aldol condensation-catalyzing enzyme
VVNHKNFEEASNYLGRTYTEHSPHAEDGIIGLKHLIEYFKKTYPEAKGEIKRVIAEGDYVFLHVHEVLKPGTKGMAVAEIFRLDHGKVAEHWDVTQDVSEVSENPNGMF